MWLINEGSLTYAHAADFMKNEICVVTPTSRHSRKKTISWGIIINSDIFKLHYANQGRNLFNRFSSIWPVIDK